MTYLRGQVIRAEVGLDEPKLFVVVSNNPRNRNLGSVLAACLTTSPKPALDSIVELDGERGFAGRVVCDDITEIFNDEGLTVLGSFSPRTMQAVNRGLISALGMG